MGRSPCCDKIGLKKGPWTPEEDQKLLAYIEEHGHGSWRALPAKAGLQRCGKSCRLRWTNYLRPDIKRGKFSIQEEQTIIQLHALLGNRWSAIATHLPKRTDNEIKNYWNTHLKKRLAKMGIDPVTHKPKNDAISSSEGQSKNAANLSHMAQWESARLEAEARLVRQSKLRSNPFPDFLTSAPSSPLSRPAAGGPPPPNRCLDILKALNGAVWTKPLDESPTSTVSYSENNAPPQMSSSNAAAFMDFVGNNNSSGTTSCDGLKEEGEEDWKGLQDLTMPMDNCPAWATVEDGDDDRGSFVETFTDLLLNNGGSSAGGGGGGSEPRFSEGCGESENAAVPAASPPPPSEYLVDNKNYWNSILHLVNSSPCDDSTMF